MVAGYIASFPPSVRKLLNQLRSLVRETIPEADECISYDIPCYKLKGKPVIYFAAFKNHISVYPAPRGVPPFKEELAAYKGGKGTVQFPLNEPLPLTLVKKMVVFRMNISMASKSGKKKQAAES